MEKIEVPLAFQHVSFFSYAQRSYDGCLNHLSHHCWKTLLFYFQLNYCYRGGGGQWGNTIPESGPELLNFIVISSQFVVLCRELRFAFIVTGVHGYLAYFSLSCQAPLLRDNVLCTETILLSGFSS